MADKISKLKSLPSSEVRKKASGSMNWLKEKIANIGKNREINRFRIGGLFMFTYDPKGKDKLPYYDRFPLVIPLEMYPDGFLGLNLHYLPVNYRIAFLDKLQDYALLGAEGELLGLRVSYDILKASRGLREFKPCLKRYLNLHVQSRLIGINPEEWDNAVLLPVQSFVKASASRVWQESLEKI